MRIRTYEEVDPAEAFRLSILAFGGAWTEEMVRRTRGRDPRYFDEFALYAEENGRILAQAVPMRFRVHLATGIEEVGGIGGVCTHPAFWGRGYARRLMEEVHGRFRKLGLRISTLTTSRNIRGYELYSRLGYAELGPFFGASRRVPSQKPPKGYRLARTTPKDLPSIHDLYRRHTRDLLGWTERDLRQLEWNFARNRRTLSKYRLLQHEGETVGYLRTRPDDQVTMEEVVVPSARHFNAAVALMERGAANRIATVNWITAAKDAARFRSRGYMVDGPIPDTTMALGLASGLRTSDLPRLFGSDSGRFVQYPSDDF